MPVGGIYAVTVGAKAGVGLARAFSRRAGGDAAELGELKALITLAGKSLVSLEASACVGEHAFAINLLIARLARTAFGLVEVLAHAVLTRAGLHGALIGAARCHVVGAGAQPHTLQYQN